MKILCIERHARRGGVVVTVEHEPEPTLHPLPERTLYYPPSGVNGIGADNARAVKRAGMDYVSRFIDLPPLDRALLVYCEAKWALDRCERDVVTVAGWVFEKRSDRDGDLHSALHARDKAYDRWQAASEALRLIDPGAQVRLMNDEDEYMSPLVDPADYELVS